MLAMLLLLPTIKAVMTRADILGKLPDGTADKQVAKRDLGARPQGYIEKLSAFASASSKLIWCIQEGGEE